MSNVLVTGATGFLGRHLCPELVRAGYTVRGTYRHVVPQTGYPQMEWLQVPDIGPETDWDAALVGIDYVIHLAGLAHRIGISDGELRASFHHINAAGTACLAHAVAERPSIKRLIFVSTIKAVVTDAVGKVTGAPPDSEYGKSKAVGEDAIRSKLTRRTDWCILRPCAIYGPGNLGNMGRLVRLVNAGIPLPLASIRNKRSFLFVGNMVDLIVTSLTCPDMSRREFEVSDGEVLSTPELMARLGRNARREVRLFRVPLWVLRGVAKAGDVAKRLSGLSIAWDTYSVERLCGSVVVDSRPLERAMGRRLQYSMEEGLRLTMQGADSTNSPKECLAS